jgi:phosphopantothenoylcysteine decarboxylase/phosphopantothenate--cysteine ligase
METKKIILGVSASIAIYKSCEIIRRLREEGLVLKVLMTKESQQLIKPQLFSSLSGNKVYQDLFGQPQAWQIGHISLAQEADLVLVAPATANIIGKIASGICDDLLTCTIFATKAPVLICPAMNENMYKNRIVQENIKKLKSLGYGFVGPRRGRLACGKIGLGCLAEVEEIVKAVKRQLSSGR